MNYRGQEINGTLALGSQLIDLMNTKNGVLIYHNYTLYFIGFEDDRIKIRKLTTAYKAQKTAIFVSDQFDKVKKLDRTRVYLVMFGEVALQIIDYKTGEVVLILLGYEI